MFKKDHLEIITGLPGVLIQIINDYRGWEIELKLTCHLQCCDSNVSKSIYVQEKKLVLCHSAKDEVSLLTFSLSDDERCQPQKRTLLEVSHIWNKVISIDSNQVSCLEKDRVITYNQEGKQLHTIYLPIDRTYFPDSVVRVSGIQSGPESQKKPEFWVKIKSGFNERAIVNLSHSNKEIKIDVHGEDFAVDTATIYFVTPTQLVIVDRKNPTKRKEVQLKESCHSKILVSTHFIFVHQQFGIHATNRWVSVFSLSGVELNSIHVWDYDLVFVDQHRFFIMNNLHILREYVVQTLI